MAVKADEAAIVKTLLDAYGIGVRGGVITPNIDDENAFRKLLGLAPANDSVVAEWGRSNGVRLPVTLQKGLAVAEGSETEGEDDNDDVN